MEAPKGRQILFHKKEGASEVPKKEVFNKLRQEVAAPAVPVEDAAARSARILTWLRDHPLFKFSTMCEEVGMDKGNLSRMVKSGKGAIAEKHIPKIETILKKYGYL